MSSEGCALSLEAVSGIGWGEENLGQSGFESWKDGSLRIKEKIGLDIRLGVRLRGWD